MSGKKEVKQEGVIRRYGCLEVNEGGDRGSTEEGEFGCMEENTVMVESGCHEVKQEGVTRPSGWLEQS